MNDSESDAILVRRVQAGETCAFEQIAIRYYSPLNVVARAYSRNPDDAADAVQNALVLAFVHLGQLQDPARLGPWLRRVTVNACREGMRRTKPMLLLEEVREVTMDETSATDTRLVTEQVLACLTPETRLTVALYYQRELSLQEIAAFQEVSTTTIKSRLRNARARLRKEWETLLQETLTRDAETISAHKEQLMPKLLRRIEAGNWIRNLVFSPDGKRVVTVADVEVNEVKFDSMICCWDAASGDPVWSVPHTSWVFSPIFLPDGRHVAVSAGLPGLRGGRDGQLLILDAATGAVHRTIPKIPVAKTIAITADGRCVAVGGQEEYSDYRSSGIRGMAIIYDLTTAEPVLKVAPHLNMISALAFSPDGKMLATDSHLRDADPEAKDLWLRSEIRLWDTASGALLHKLDRPKDRGTRHNIAFSPDGTLLAAPNGTDGEILIWEPATGQLIQTLEGSGEKVFVLAFSPDGQTLACGCGDDVVRVWNPRTGELRRTMTGFSGSVDALAFAPDGKTLATADGKGIVQFWKL